MVTGRVGHSWARAGTQSASNARTAALEFFNPR
jgi:hypothetical protein